MVTQYENLVLKTLRRTQSTQCTLYIECTYSLDKLGHYLISYVEICKTSWVLTCDFLVHESEMKIKSELEIIFKSR